jgi:hypothetical protein
MTTRLKRFYKAGTSKGVTQGDNRRARNAAAAALLIAVTGWSNV